MTVIPKKIFLSYSKKDEALKDEFIEFMQPLVMAGRIEIWNDQEIVVGELWDEAIKRALEAADIILFLISPSFLANAYVNKVEIVKAFALYEKGKKLVPIILRPSAVDDHIIQGENYKLMSFQGVPYKRRPVVEWESHDAAWMDVVRRLKHLIP